VAKIPQAIVILDPTNSTNIGFYIDFEYDRGSFKENNDYPNWRVRYFGFC
jgi:hypothetical protein